jgi:hypothetical protein
MAIFCLEAASAICDKISRAEFDNAYGRRYSNRVFYISFYRKASSRLFIQKMVPAKIIWA